MILHQKIAGEGFDIDLIYMYTPRVYITRVDEYSVNSAQGGKGYIFYKFPIYDTISYLDTMPYHMLQYHIVSFMIINYSIILYHMIFVYNSIGCNIIFLFIVLIDIVSYNTIWNEQYDLLTWYILYCVKRVSMKYPRWLTRIFI